MQPWIFVLTLSFALIVCVMCHSKYTRHKRVSDPLDIGVPWPSSGPVDINLLDIPTGNVPTVDTDIPGEPLGPEDFNRPVKEVHMVMNIGERRDPIEMAGLFQGDIMLTAQDVITKLPMFSRNAVIYRNRTWVNGVIPYVISKAYNLNERSIIATGIKKYHNETCIRFVPRTNENDYIHFLKGDGCSSSVGRVGGAQPVSLGPGCLFVGVVMHELMHATGFWHEQSRADRDDFIKIVWDNIQTGMEFNFKKYNWSEIQNLGAQYDPKSIMHYGPYAFAKDRQKPTIIPLSADPIGQRDGFSLLDKLKIKKLYGCEGSAFINTVFVSTNLTSPDLACEDFGKNCATWEASGECDKNPLWMKSNCRKSCSECGKSCGDAHEHCLKWANDEECTKNPPYMLIYCKNSCGLCKAANSLPNICADTNKHCAVWAENGQCRINADYMLSYCGKSCKSC